MPDLLRHPWFRVLLIATAIATCSWALRETAIITLPIVGALGEVLLPLAIGFTIAYMLTPLVDALDRIGLHRWPATLVLFVAFCAVLTLTGWLVVPAVAKQSTQLASRLFQGESYADLNHNGHWDEGEPYEDRNGNGRYDAGGLLSQWATWASQQQDWVRRRLNIGLSRDASAFLALYGERTTAERAALDQGLEAARARLAPDRWPAGFAVAGADGAAEWNAAWPGPTAEEIAAAAAQLPPPSGIAWRASMVAHGARLAEQHRRLAAALRLARAGGQGGDPALDELAGRVRAALQAPPSDAATRAARDAAARLADESRRGQTLSAELLGDLGGDADAGGRVFGALMTSVERRVQVELDTAPARIGAWLSASLGNLGVVLSVSLAVLLVPVYAFFLTLAMPGIRRTVRRYVPAHGRARTLRLLHDIERVVAAFFRGRLIVCVLCALIAGVGFAVLGVPYAALFGIGVGLATAVPFAGLVVLLPALAVHLADGGSALGACGVVLVYAVVQALETVVLTPTIMGREVELHPVVLLIALLLCGKLLGILGLILAVPIAATLRIVAREFLLPRLRTAAELPPRTVAIVNPAFTDAVAP